MPIYVYECNNCEHQFELLQSMNSEPVQECPKCLHAADRVPAVSNFTLKGAGFYVNDYPKGS